MSWLFQNRMAARDFDSAEKLAREAVRLTEENRTGSDSAQRSAAVSELADVRRAEGHGEEADDLIKMAAPAPEPTSAQNRS